jgi:hypothetical protein
MYRFSLSQFVRIFQKSLLVAQSLSQITKKLEIAKMQLFSNVLDDLGIGLFKIDRVMLALHMVRGVSNAI